VNAKSSSRELVTNGQTAMLKSMCLLILYVIVLTSCKATKQHAGTKEFQRFHCQLFHSSLGLRCRWLACGPAWDIMLQLMVFEVRE